MTTAQSFGTSAPKKRSRRPLTPTQRRAAQSAFLAEFARTANMLHSCRVVAIDRQTVYNWLAKDADFKARYEDATEDAKDEVEAEIRRRAIDGWDEPVFHQGEQCGTVRKYSDTLLIVLAKARMPEKYRENIHHDYNGEQRLTVVYEHDWRRVRLGAGEVVALPSPERADDGESEAAG